MENNSSPGNQTDWRSLRNFAIAILLILALMLFYYFMLVKDDFVFDKFNDLIGFIAILCLHPIMILSAFKGEKRQPGTVNKTQMNVAVKPPSSEKIAQDKKGRKKTINRIITAVMSLIVIDIYVIILWRAPLWLRWSVIFVAAGAFAYIFYSLSKKYGEQRGLYSALGQLGLVFLGWLLGRWLGIIFISMPLLLNMRGLSSGIQPRA